MSMKELRSNYEETMEIIRNSLEFHKLPLILVFRSSITERRFHEFMHAKFNILRYLLFFVVFFFVYGQVGLLLVFDILFEDSTMRFNPFFRGIPKESAIVIIIANFVSLLLVILFTIYLGMILCLESCINIRKVAWMKIYSIDISFLLILSLYVVVNSLCGFLVGFDNIETTFWFWTVFMEAFYIFVLKPRFVLILVYFLVRILMTGIIMPIDVLVLSGSDVTIFRAALCLVVPFVFFLLIFYFYFRHEHLRNTFVILSSFRRIRKLLENQANVSGTVIESLTPYHLLSFVPDLIKFRQGEHNGESCCQRFLQFDGCVLECDIVGFTKFCQVLPSKSIVDMLNKTNMVFDDYCIRYSFFKIKCTGDSMTAYSVSCEKEDFVNAVNFGLGVIQCFREVNQSFESRFDGLRVGIAAGKFTLFICLKKKITSEICGEVVKKAILLESRADLNSVKVCPRIREAVKDEFEVSGRDVISSTYFTRVEMLDDKESKLEDEEEPERTDESSDEDTLTEPKLTDEDRVTSGIIMSRKDGDHLTKLLVDEEEIAASLKVEEKWISLFDGAKSEASYSSSGSTTETDSIIYNLRFAWNVCCSCCFTPCREARFLSFTFESISVPQTLFHQLCFVFQYAHVVVFMCGKKYTCAPEIALMSVHLLVTVCFIAYQLLRKICCCCGKRPNCLEFFVYHLYFLLSNIGIRALALRMAISAVMFEEDDESGAVFEQIAFSTLFFNVAFQTFDQSSSFLWRMCLTGFDMFVYTVLAIFLFGDNVFFYISCLFTLLTTVMIVLPTMFCDEMEGRRSYHIENNLERVMKKVLLQKKSNEEIITSILPITVYKKMVKKRTGECAEERVGFVGFLKIFMDYDKISESTSVETFRNLHNILHDLSECIETSEHSYVVKVGDDYLLFLTPKTGYGKISKNEIFDDSVESLEECQKIFEKRKGDLLDENCYLGTGIAHGSYCAGIIGQEAIRYDIFGATVNLAARLTEIKVEENDTGIVVMADEIENVYGDEFWNNYLTKSLGLVNLKGIGECEISSLKKGDVYKTE